MFLCGFLCVLFGGEVQASVFYVFLVLCSRVLDVHVCLCVRLCVSVYMGQLDQIKPYTDSATRTDRGNYPNVHGL